MESSTEFLQLLREIRDLQIEMLAVVKASEERLAKLDGEWRANQDIWRKNQDQWNVDQELRDNEWRKSKDRHELAMVKWRECNDLYLKQIRPAPNYGRAALTIALLGLAFGIGLLLK